MANDSAEKPDGRPVRVVCIDLGKISITPNRTKPAAKVGKKSNILKSWRARYQLETNYASFWLAALTSSRQSYSVSIIGFMVQAKNIFNVQKY